ncbi:BphX family protein [Agromyces atrinae]|uniref:BphX family protein n=1 Tax=Agromyces atrinae TaxID=592376 RepID=A0A4Q2M2M0_9MICO|nr:BphX family protein [Agromyces atrinae]NYD68657.1 hypothetical protein [Agromyces atrinae]RXZ86029.1 hypothetical protein ESP50_12555 [Agromyces atrinae]
MTLLTWWFRLTGIAYIALGISWIPVLNALRLDAVVPGFDAPEGSTAYAGFLDWMLVFGLEMIVVGVVLIAASWRPWRSAPLVVLIVALSLVRGIAHDIYMIVNGYSLVANLVFVAFHTAVIVVGVIAYRSARRDAWAQGVDSARPAIDVRSQVA